MFSDKSRMFLENVHSWTSLDGWHVSMIFRKPEKFEEYYH